MLRKISVFLLLNYDHINHSIVDMAYRVHVDVVSRSLGFSIASKLIL